MATWSRPSAELIAAFDALIERLPGAERRQMFGCPCAFAQGQLFTGLHEESWLVRLPEESRSELTELGGEPFAPMGRAMREYVLLPTEIRDNDVERTHWVRRALQYAQSLPPKTPKKGASKKGTSKNRAPKKGASEPFSERLKRKKK